MTDEGRKKIREVAERLRAAGIRVTTRAVYDQLGRKGSYNAMAAALADWRAEVDYRPDIEHHGLPDAYKVRYLDFAAEIIEYARAEEAAAFDVERANAEVRRRAYETELAEAGATVDQRLERVRDLQAEVAHLRGMTGVEVPTGDAGVVLEPGGTQDRADLADEAWMQVANEICAMLAANGPMTAAEILDALSVDTRQRSMRAGLPLSRGSLGFYMRRMADDEGPVVVADGRFSYLDAGVEVQPLPMMQIDAGDFPSLVTSEIIDLLRQTGRPMTLGELKSGLSRLAKLMVARSTEGATPFLAAVMQEGVSRKGFETFLDKGDGTYDVVERLKPRSEAA